MVDSDAWTTRGRLVIAKSKTIVGIRMVVNIILIR
jgi:hypothetical protein